MRRRASALVAAAALTAGGAGLVMAQDQGAPPPAAAVQGSAGAAPSSPAPPEASPANTTGAPDAAATSAPPDEAEPPAAATAVQEAQAPPEPPAAPAPPPAPLSRPRFTTAVLQATDKVTAETLRFEAKVGETVRYKGLVITPRACEATAADEAQADAFGYLEIISQPSPVPGRATPPPRPVFHGWMSANSPSLNPLQSPGYDVWVIACRTAAPPAPAGHA